MENNRLGYENIYLQSYQDLIKNSKKFDLIVMNPPFYT
jgi:tRNA1(Val) A37 N6-methylase TrmN6